MRTISFSLAFSVYWWCVLGHLIQLDLLFWVSRMTETLWFFTIRTIILCGLPILSQVTHIIFHLIRLYIMSLVMSSATKFLVARTVGLVIKLNGTNLTYRITWRRDQDFGMTKRKKVLSPSLSVNLRKFRTKQSSNHNSIFSTFFFYTFYQLHSFLKSKICRFGLWLYFNSMLGEYEKKSTWSEKDLLIKFF